MAVSTYLSVITLNVNGLNSPIKRQSGWINLKKKVKINHKTHLCMFPAGDSLQILGHTQTESEEVEKIFHANGNQKKGGIAILISDKTDLKTKTNKKQGYYRIMKESIQQNDLT